MYELLSGKHPIWEKGDDKVKYKQKILHSQTIRFGKRFNHYTQGLIEKLCHPKPSQRYTVDQALSHPWITRNFDSEIPRNHFEQNMFLTDVDEKLRKLVNTMFVLGMIEHHNNHPKEPAPPEQDNKRSIQKGEVMNASIRGLQLRVSPFIRR